MLVSVRVVDDQVGVAQDSLGQTGVHVDRAQGGIPPSVSEHGCLSPAMPMYVPEQDDRIGLWTAGKRPEDFGGHLPAAHPSGVRHQPGNGGSLGLQRLRLLRQKLLELLGATVSIGRVKLPRHHGFTNHHGKCSTARRTGATPMSFDIMYRPGEM